MRMLGIAITVASVVLLSGCLPADPVVTPVPEASSTPVFASEDDALAAAEAAYAAYLKVSDAVAQGGGADPSAFEDVVTPDWLSTELDSADRFQKSGRHQTGESKVASVVLQQVDQLSGAASVITYVCVDTSHVRFVDANGADVTPVDRPTVVPLQVSFESSETTPTTLLVGGNEPWSGDSFC